MTDFAAYQRGGQYWPTLVSRYGEAGANRIAAAASSEDQALFTTVFSNVQRGRPASEDRITTTSTLREFGTLLATDPLGAPMEGLNNQIGKAVWNVLKNPWVLLVVAGGVVYVVWRLGGISGIKRSLK